MGSTITVTAARGVPPLPDLATTVWPICCRVSAGYSVLSGNELLPEGS